MTITAPLVVTASNMFDRWNREPAEPHQDWWVKVTLEEFQDALEDCPGGDYDTITEIVESRAKVLHQETTSHSPVRDLVAALTECAAALTAATEDPWEPRSVGLQRRDLLPDPDQGLQWSDPRLAALEHNPDQLTGSDLDDDIHVLRSMFHTLRTDPDLCATIAAQSATGNPDLRPLGLFDPAPPIVTVTAAVATWVSSHPRQADGPHHIATLARWAGLPAVDVKNITGAPLPGVRAPLVTLLTRLPGPAAPNWVMLLDDLTNWHDQAVRDTWFARFYRPTKN